MKLFWMKNKALIAALCAVLVLGVAFWGGLRLFAGNEMQDADPGCSGTRRCSAHTG